MKKHNITIISLMFILFMSCKVEDSSQFATLKDRVQNEGYFPLAMNNSWLYETRIASAMNKDSSFVYTKDDPQQENTTISLTSDIISNGVSRIDYGFADVDYNKSIGSFIGTYSQVSKVNGEYRRKKVVSALSAENNGETFKGPKFKFEDVFLVDNPKVGQIISSKDSVDTSPDGGVVLEYNIKTIVVGLLDKMPDYLTNNPSVDGQLKQYSNILHTREVFKIKRLIYKEKARNRIQLNAQIKIVKGGKLIFNFDKPDQGLGGNISIKPTSFIPGIGGLLPGLWKIPFNIRNGNVRVKFNNELNSCESTANINIDKFLQGPEMTVVTDQDSYHIDRYYAKNVGKIKSITTFKEVRSIVDVAGYLETSNFEIELIKDIPECGLSDYNTFAGFGKVQVDINGYKIDTPIKISDDIIIENLKSYEQRKTLN